MSDTIRLQWKDPDFMVKYRDEWISAFELPDEAQRQLRELGVFDEYLVIEVNPETGLIVGKS